jgi:hypothetical protein
MRWLLPWILNGLRNECSGDPAIHSALSHGRVVALCGSDVAC